MRSSSDAEAWRWWSAEADPASFLESGLMYISQFPTLVAMSGCHQNPRWHTEDVWTHTVMVVREASRHFMTSELSGDDREILFYACLLHDSGKPATTKKDRNGNIISRGHSSVSADTAERFLRLIGASSITQREVAALCRQHMWLKEYCVDELNPIQRILRDADQRGRKPCVSC